MAIRIAMFMLGVLGMAGVLALCLGSADPVDGPKRSEQESNTAKALIAKGARINMTTDPSNAPVRSISLDDPMIDDEAIAMLGDFPHLSELIIGVRCKFSAARLSVVADHPELIALGTYFSTDEMLQNLGKCPKLGVLSVSSRAFTDRSASHLPAMKGLYNLHLRNTTVTDEGMIDLGRVATLRELGLDGANIGDAGLKHLRELRKLRELDLSNTKITDAGLIALEKMSRLYRLKLTGLPLTASGLRHLKPCSGLRHLHVHGEGITDAAIDELDDLDLDFLWLDNTKVSKPRQLKMLEENPGLKIYP